jgi:hypothetical protein
MGPIPPLVVRVEHLGYTYVFSNWYKAIFFSNTVHRIPMIPQHSLTRVLKDLILLAHRHVRVRAGMNPCTQDGLSPIAHLALRQGGIADTLKFEDVVEKTYFRFESVRFIIMLPWLYLLFQTTLHVSLPAILVG